ncbi:MAG: proline--tRNA ligase [Alphaproteobacteria bacterium]|nr:proline--tRNA ligase [Alphaproteobacteria bacterium]
MKIENLCVRRLIGDVSGATTRGHKIAIRGGYIHQTFQGGYTLSPLGWRVVKNIEDIIRSEMNAIGGQEILMPVVSGADLWRKSGRYDTIDSLVKFTGRNGTDYVINPTHEEVVVDFVKSVLESYRQMPFMVYQIQGKFRDELRARAGLVRTREFIMKDAYSFHETWTDLQNYYDRCWDAYNKLFRRCGLKNFVVVQSATGDMGGKIAHEFQLINEMGEDTIFICDECGYKCNKELVDNETAVCPKCGAKMRVVRGIEIGNIFQLGTFYSDSMELNYTASDGTSRHPIMGCYGIGVGRTMAAILEESSNENGPVWNMETAPFAVHVIGIGGKDNRITEISQKIHDDLVANGIETILDNRDIHAGEKFADADLIAAPIRLIVSDKNLANGVIEVKYRVNDFDTSRMSNEFKVADVINRVQDTIRILSHK